MSILKTSNISKENNIPLFKVISNAREYSLIPKSTAKTMEVFAGIIEYYQQKFSVEPLSAVLKDLLHEIGYFNYIETQKSDIKVKERRLTNVNEFLFSVKKFAEGNTEANLQTFLERISFFAETDKNSENKSNNVSIMTLHSAKGLEFSYVFMVGMSEGIFPNQRSIDDSGEDEERRLCYVGITRAKQELTFSMAKCRSRFGETIRQYPSRFLQSIKPELLSAPIIGEVKKEIKELQNRESRAAFFSQIRKLEESENN
tara:strand:- start:3083 stop:3856 length:774 start_codon:yes stop_codon:yes gene_type:complete